MLASVLENTHEERAHLLERLETLVTLHDLGVLDPEPTWDRFLDDDVEIVTRIDFADHLRLTLEQVRVDLEHLLRDRERDTLRSSVASIDRSHGESPFVPLLDHEHAAVSRGEETDAHHPRKLVELFSPQLVKATARLLYRRDVLSFLNLDALLHLVTLKKGWNMCHATAA